jgi:hypothetical protein
VLQTLILEIILLKAAFFNFLPEVGVSQVGWVLLLKFNSTVKALIVCVKNDE